MQIRARKIVAATPKIAIILIARESIGVAIGIVVRPEVRALFAKQSAKPSLA